MLPRASIPLEQSMPLSQSASKTSLKQGASNSSTFRVIVQTLLFSKEVWLQNALVFLAARAAVMGELYPFGPALFLAFLVAGERRRAVAAALSATLGVWTVLPVHQVGAWAAVMVVLLLVSWRTSSGASDRRKGRWVARVVMGAWLFFLARALVEGVASGAWVEGVSAGVEGLVIMIAALIAVPAAVSESFVQEPFDRKSIVAAAGTIAVAGLGLSGIEWGGFHLEEVWHRWVTLMAALIGGAAGGAAMGTAIGVLTSLGGWLPLGGMGLYGVSGLFAGLLAGRQGKGGVIAGYLLGHMIVSVHAAGAGEIVWSGAHTALAAAAFLLVPQRWISRLRRGLPGSEMQVQLQRARERRLRSAISERLGQVSGVFGEVAEAFARVNRQGPQGRDVEEGVHAIVEDAWKRQCEGCSQMKSCWEVHLYATYWETVDLIATAERKGRVGVSDLPAGLRERCVRPGGFIAAVNASCGSNAGGHQSLERKVAMEIVPYQLRGAAELVERVADQVRLETDRAEALESALWDEFALRRIQVRHLRVADDGMHPEVDVEYAGPCDGYGSCAVTLLAAIESRTGEAYTCELNCRSGLEETCWVRLVPEPPLELNVAWTGLAKAGTPVSGDTCAQVELGGGKVAMVLSDGMGVGDRAALESEAAVGMLEKMMRAGFSRTFAVQTVNSVLLLRSSDEIFATLDVAVVDRFSGEVEFLKVGSSPTFIKRGGDVEIIRSESLPVGILSEIDLKERGVQLEPDDVVVMMTDGILDAIPERGDKEEWIARMLRRVDTTEPKQLLRMLIDRAKQATGGVIQDDMTVIVARIEATHPPQDEAAAQEIGVEADDVPVP